MAQPAEQQVMQANYSDAQVREDILLLVEKNWKARNGKRCTAYLALNANINLAKELCVRNAAAYVKDGDRTRSDDGGDPVFPSADRTSQSWQ